MTVMTEPFTIVIPWPGKPKARPRVTSNGTFMPPEYMEWKQNIVDLLAYDKRIVEGYCHLEMEFTKLEVFVRVIPITYDYQRDKGVRGDLDNLVGGVMDALQDAGLIDNDERVVGIDASIRNRIGYHELTDPGDIGRARDVGGA